MKYHRRGIKCAHTHNGCLPWMETSRLALLGIFYVLLGVSITCTRLCFFHLVLNPGGDAHWTGGTAYKISTLAIAFCFVLFFFWRRALISMRFWLSFQWDFWDEEIGQLGLLVLRKCPWWPFSTGRAGKTEQRNCSQLWWAGTHR